MSKNIHIGSNVCLDVNQTIEADFLSKILDRKLTQNLRGEVAIVHLTNKFKDASSMQGLSKVISGTLKAHFRTILILPGKLNYYYFAFHNFA